MGTIENRITNQALGVPLLAERSFLFKDTVNPLHPI